MNIVKNLEQYDLTCVYFCEPIKNNVMNEGNFIRILYSTADFVLNGVTLLLPLCEINVEKYYNKYKCIFSYALHKEIIEKFKVVEEDLLKKYNIPNKTPLLKIHEQLKNGNIKFFLEKDDKISNGNFVLKISGIWETDNQYGVTYKFLKAQYPS